MTAAEGMEFEITLRAYTIDLSGTKTKDAGASTDGVMDSMLHHGAVWKNSKGT